MKIDFLGHFEFLEEDMNLVAQKIGHPISLGHQNRSSNNASDYRKLYDTDMIEIVGSRFSEEIDLFGYAFDAKYPTRRYSKRLDRHR